MWLWVPRDARQKVWYCLFKLKVTCTVFKFAYLENYKAVGQRFMSILKALLNGSQILMKKAWYECYQVLSLEYHMILYSSPNYETHSI